MSFVSSLLRHRSDVTDPKSPLRRHRSDVAAPTSPLRRHRSDVLAPTSSLRRLRCDVFAPTSSLRRLRSDAFTPTPSLRRLHSDVISQASPSLNFSGSSSTVKYGRQLSGIVFNCRASSSIGHLLLSVIWSNFISTLSLIRSRYDHCYIVTILIIFVFLVHRRSDL